MRRLLLAALFLAPAALPAAAAERGVDVRDNSYSPTPLTVALGDTVKWTHRGNALHTVSWDDGTPGSGHMLPGGPSYSRTFNTAGSFAYHCDVHQQQGMRGTVVVQAAASTTTTRPTTTTTRRTTTTLDAEESSVTAPGETTTTSATAPGETTTTLDGEATSTTADGLAAPGDDDPGDDDGDPSNAGPAAVAALLLAAVSGSAALAVKRGL